MTYPTPRPSHLPDSMFVQASRDMIPPVVRRTTAVPGPATGDGGTATGGVRPYAGGHVRLAEGPRHVQHTHRVGRAASIDPDFQPITYMQAAAMAMLLLGVTWALVETVLFHPVVFGVAAVGVFTTLGLLALRAIDNEADQ